MTLRNALPALERKPVITLVSCFVNVTVPDLSSYSALEYQIESELPRPLTSAPKLAPISSNEVPVYVVWKTIPIFAFSIFCANADLAGTA